MNETQSILPFLNRLDIQVHPSLISKIETTELPVEFTTAKLFGSYSYETKSSGIFYYKVFLKNMDGYIMIENKLGVVRLVRNCVAEFEY